MNASQRRKFNRLNQKKFKVGDIIQMQKSGPWMILKRVEKYHWKIRELSGGCIHYVLPYDFTLIHRNQS